MDRLEFVTRVNPEYVDRLYQQYQRDPRSVDESWRAHFAAIDSGGNGDSTAYANLSSSPESTSRTTYDLPAGTGYSDAGAVPPLTIGVHKLVHSYRELGHLVANLDPLGHNRATHPLLDLSQFNMSDADLDRTVGSGGFLGPIDGTLRDLITKLKATYCRQIGVEFQNISDKAQREWLAQQMEPVLNRPNLSAEQARAILFQLVAAEEFEQFMRRRWPEGKTFSLEGAESLIPMLNTLVDEGAALGAEEICFGMPHRGRLSVLAHVLNKPYEVIFSEFKYTNVHQEWEGDGDVKYHLGYANDRPTPNSKSVHLSLSPNPSHLELVNPVVEGIVRCKQKIRGDKDHSKVVPILLHGDAAFCGQGVIFETLNLSELPFWRTGGTIHVIVNNQIGFTTPPHETRFTPYPTDVAKMIQAPIFHVNGDDPETVAWAAKLAIAFRQKFKCDVFIDLWCYRRFGHNEQDEPMFTQPKMYKQIKEHKTTRELYSAQSVTQGRVETTKLEDMKKVAKERLELAFKQSDETRPRQKTATPNPLWKSMVRIPTDWSATTKVPRDVLLKIAEGVNRLPADFKANEKLLGSPRSTYTTRLEAVKKGEGIDWGCGEMLAMGALLLEGTPIRFTGQDVQRGTFSHRQAVLFDQNTGEPYTPLNFLISDQKAHLTIQNSMLSELAVLGFEYGFASADPRNLVIWEAQFGDFVNGAQAMIDQFIVAAESKWQLMNGLVMMLPHGYEGQGPEHSNAYIERWLTLCAENNIQVVVPSTPAQVFHALRRQIHRKFRKPLMLMMPKSMLRQQNAASKIEEFTDGAMQLVIDDPTTLDREKVRRVLFCSGKVFYTLQNARSEKDGAKDTAIVRVEQLYPFPKKEIQAILAKYRNARDVTWVQDEPRNRGAWSFMEPRLRELLPDPATLHYVGRDEAASPATGSNKMHKAEELELVQQALEIAPPAKPAAPAGNSSAGVLQAAATVPEPAPMQAMASSPITQQLM